MKRILYTLLALSIFLMDQAMAFQSGSKMKGEMRPDSCLRPYIISEKNAILESILMIAGKSSVKGMWAFDLENPQYAPPAVPDYSGTGTIINVGIGDDIETAIAGATAGDTIQLAAGTYTITGEITCNKLLHIKGAGIGVTIITTSTADMHMITFTTTDGSWLSNLTLQTTADNTTNRAMFRGSKPCTVSNVSFLNTATSTPGETMDSVLVSAASAKIVVSECSFFATGAADTHRSLSNSYSGGKITAIDCTISGSGGTSATAGNNQVYQNGSSGIDLYGCYITDTTAVAEGVLRCDSAALNLYNCTVNGSGAGAYDIRQTGGTLTLYNTTLVNRTTSGTITYGGTARTITDLSGNGHDITLGSNSSSLSPSYAGFAPSLTMAGTAATSWSAGDSDDFTPGVNGFTVVALLNPTSMTNLQAIVKINDGVRQEWGLLETGGTTWWVMYNSDGSRWKACNIALPASVAGSWHTLVGTSSTNTEASTMLLYGDGSLLATTPSDSGNAFTVSNTTSDMKNYWSGSASYSSAKYSIVLIIARELTAGEVATVSYYLLEYVMARQ